jgi:outer membrane protein
LRRILRLAGLPVAALFAMATPASAETLREALESAYQTNPTLAGARAGQRATDETVPIARANGLPDFGITGAYSENVNNDAQSVGYDRLLNGRASLSVPLYTGGAVRNSVRAAQSRVKAGQDNLRGVESDVFTAVVAVYMDVLRDTAIVGLNRNQVDVLKTNLEATRDRFEVGDLTRTDVAQSEARLAIAQSQLEGAEAQLIASRERYVQWVGHAPTALAQPPELPNLPADSDAAVAVALEQNPDLAAVKKLVDAAKYDVGTARSSRLPKVQAVADDSYSHFLDSLGAGVPPQSRNAITAGVQLSIPIFQGGAAGAQIRQAQARSGQVMEQMIEAERGVIAQTRSAYASWRAARAVIVSSEKAVSANTLSLEGVRAENSVGNRSILDILNAEQELLNAKVQLVSAQRSAYVAGFSLLSAMGRAEARDLGLDGGALYDPNVNFERVRGKIWDWSNDPEPKAQSTRTVDTPAQNPDIAP